jgi:hypothetical protein
VTALTAVRGTLLRLDDRKLRLDVHATFDPEVRTGLEETVAAFVAGYRTAVVTQGAEQTATAIDRAFDPLLRGFAYEGAGMWAALLDELQLGRGRRLSRFAGGPARAHSFLVAVGAGFAVARVPWARCAPVRRAAAYGQGFDALVLDGFGFHEALFHGQATLLRQVRPPGVHGEAARCFDGGVGRALWFVEGADPGRLVARVRSFAPDRHPDLWAGVGLATAFAGHVHQDLDRFSTVVAALVQQAGAHASRFGLGVVFAAASRLEARCPSPWTDEAARVALGEAAPTAAEVGLRLWREAVEAVEESAPPCSGYRTACQRVLAELARPGAGSPGIATKAPPA